MRLVIVCRRRKKKWIKMKFIKANTVNAGLSISQLQICLKKYIYIYVIYTIKRTRWKSIKVSKWIDKTERESIAFLGWDGHFIATRYGKIKKKKACNWAGWMKRLDRGQNRVHQCKKAFCRCLNWTMPLELWRREFDRHQCLLCIWPFG